MICVGGGNDMRWWWFEIKWNIFIYSDCSKSQNYKVQNDIEINTIFTFLFVQQSNKFIKKVAYY